MLLPWLKWLKRKGSFQFRNILTTVHLTWSITISRKLWKTARSNVFKIQFGYKSVPCLQEFRNQIHLQGTFHLRNFFLYSLLWTDCTSRKEGGRLRILSLRWQMPSPISPNCTRHFRGQVGRIYMLNKIHTQFIELEIIKWPKRWEWNREIWGCTTAIHALTVPLTLFINYAIHFTIGKRICINLNICVYIYLLEKCVYIHTELKLPAL